MKKPVLVVGGGIAGIQASLDLAENGVPVFLVEESASIGGRMAQLDKTFPTNDCSACILAPKVTSCFNHPLVRTFTWSSLKSVSGSEGSFRATVERRPRFVDESKCTGCAECSAVCPIEVDSEFDMGMGKRKAVFKPFAQAVPNKVAIDKRGTSPCKYNCPAMMDAHGYVALAGRGRYDEALAVVRRTTPFAGTLGRICLHNCESACSRRAVDDSLSLASIKRFIADKELASGKAPSIAAKPKRPEKVAVIGAGPAGLNCAYALAREGLSVTVFEALDVGGGMLKVGIPDYRLDKAILRREIAIVESLGVEIRYGAKVGAGLTLADLKAQGCAAIFVGIGAHREQTLGVPGEGSEGVLSSVGFLRDLNLGRPVAPKAGSRVLVVGGGNVAMDAARSALRLGCEVTVVYRRTEAEMPANEWEIEHAREEGVRFAFLESPVAVVAEGGRTAGLACARNELGPPDASGRRSPVPVPGSEHVIPADFVIAAIGQTPEREALEAAGLSGFDRRGRVGSDDMGTPIPGVFAGGDCRLGPATAIEAIADGNKAARAILNYLDGASLPLQPKVIGMTDIAAVDTARLIRGRRAAMPMLSLARRRTSFEEVELGYDEATALAEANRCADCSICCDCRLCESACKAGAIDHAAAPETLELDVAAVVLATGFSPSERVPDGYGYGHLPDVVTAMEYERILSASGPYAGHVARPSDHTPPRRIAFLQCAGSRDCVRGAEYCSSVCCMFAVKEAMITKEHLPSVESIDIYYMDIRAHGKDFDRYVESAKAKYGIRFIPARASDVVPDGSGGLKVVFGRQDGGRGEERYDLVVLSAGLNPDGRTKALASGVGLKTDKYGFLWTDERSPTLSSVPGFFACGAAAGPKDIPETVMEASAAAAGAAAEAKRAAPMDASSERWFAQEAPVPIRDVSKEAVRMGVFVCHCGVNIGGYVDVPAVVEYAKTLPFVVYATDNLYTCSVDAQKAIIEKIAEHSLNRVVVASCTPRTHEPLFQEVLKKSGLNPYLFNMANIRDQCSWVHMDDRASATSKAMDLVRMAGGKAEYARELVRKRIPVTPSALVIGAGMAGMSAAIQLSDLGFKAYLIDKADAPGGNARRLHTTLAGRPARAIVAETMARALADPLIEFIPSASIDSVEGFVGNFKTVLSTKAGRVEIAHGAAVVAAGAREEMPAGFGYGSISGVVTHSELEEALAGSTGFGDGGVSVKAAPELGGGAPLRVAAPGGAALCGADRLSDRLRAAKSIVMIQCAGSRTAERPYCSRVCCNQAVRNAIALLEDDPERAVTVLYRDMRTYGTAEALYRKARKLGAAFIRYDPDSPPEVHADGDGIRVSIRSPYLGGAASVRADIVSLAQAIAPDREVNGAIARLFKVPLNQDGFFMEAHAKLRPVDFATEGVYVAGLSHSPRGLREAMAQGRAAAARAATVISKEVLESEGTIAKVDISQCVGCGACEAVCAYGAIAVTEVKVRGRVLRRAQVNDALCKGCGTCAVNCRCGAVDVDGFADRQIVGELEALLRA